MTETADTQNATPTSQPIPETRVDALEAAAQRMLEAEKPAASPAEKEQPKAQEVKAPNPDRFSRRYLELQKKERELKKREQELRQQPAQEQQAAPQQNISMEQLTRLAKQNPDQFLRQFGIDARYVNEFFLNQGKPTQEVQFELMAHDLEDKLTQFRREQEAFNDHQRRMQEQQVISDWQAQAASMLDRPEMQERFALLTDTHDDPVSAIYDRVVKDFERQQAEGIEQPTLLTIEQAAQSLEDDFRATLQGLLGSKSVQRILGTQETKPASGLLNQHQQAPGQVPAEKPLQATTIDDDPLEAYARRILEAESRVAQSDEQTPKGITITKGHMQQLPDRNSDSLEQELIERALRELREGKAF